LVKLELESECEGTLTSDSSDSTSAAAIVRKQMKVGNYVNKLIYASAYDSTKHSKQNFYLRVVSFKSSTKLYMYRN
jgi:hypothetical protein